MKRLRTALYRPFLLTATEPIIGLFALYLTVIYIILFTFLDGYVDPVFEPRMHADSSLTGTITYSQRFMAPHPESQDFVS